jgi:hypothetical protein
MKTSEYLKQSGLPVAVQTHVLRQLDKEAGSNLILKNLNSASATVIRDADFKWFEKAVQGAAGLASAGTLIGWAPSAIAALVLLMYDIHKKGMTVDAVDAALLQQLRTGAKNAAKLSASVATELSAADIEGRLQLLSERTAVGGCAIVKKQADDTWTAVGI